MKIVDGPEDDVLGVIPSALLQFLAPAFRELKLLERVMLWGLEDRQTKEVGQVCSRGGQSSLPN